MSWRWKETSKESEKDQLIWLEENMVSLKPREDNGPRRMDGSALPQAADKSKMKTKNLPLDAAVVIGDLPREVLESGGAKSPNWRRFKTTRKRSMKRQYCRHHFFLAVSLQKRADKWGSEGESKW